MGRAFAGLRETYRPVPLIRPDRDICSFHSSPMLRAYAKKRGIKPVLMSHGDWFVPASTSDVADARGFSSEQHEFLIEATQGAFSVAGVGEVIRCEGRRGVL